MRTIITIYFILLFSVLSFSQGATSKSSMASILPISEEKPVLLKPINAYGTFGTVLIAGTASINVEYHLLNTRHIKLGPKLSYGGSAVAEFDGGTYISPSVSLLIGIDNFEKWKSSYFLELNYGHTSGELKNSRLFDSPYFFGGIRIVGGNRVVYRLGFGYPELLQYSIGYNF
ncbi:hypothetical protein N9L92_03115 [Saprospiraceae bacterium]|nr:hypothetical protein [Saprospiraceae bacterium]